MFGKKFHRQTQWGRLVPYKNERKQADGMMRCTMPKEVLLRSNETEYAWSLKGQPM